MLTTYQDLLQSRPTRWRQYGALRATPYPQEAEKSNAIPVIERILALGLVLEQPVKSWVLQANPKELPISSAAKSLLLRNCGDEDIHYHAIKRAIETYPVSEQVMKDAEAIASEWNTSCAHPLENAALAERGVFLISLAILRIFGTPSQTLLAANISRDEQIHISTNLGILQDIGLGINPPAHLEVFRHHTLGWMLEGLNFPELGIDADFFRQQSNLLVEDGYAPELEALTDGADYKPPFENSNQSKY